MASGSRSHKNHHCRVAEKQSDARFGCLAVLFDVNIQVNKVFAVQFFHPRAVFAVVERHGEKALLFEELT